MIMRWLCGTFLSKISFNSGIRISNRTAKVLTNQNARYNWPSANACNTFCTQGWDM